MEIRAFAKVNLTLEVLGRRADGYHEVRTILQTIDLADLLEVRPGPALRVECDDPTLSGESNLVWRAAVALAAHRGVRPHASILVHKGIPVAMGLGGGSSDAAAALVALNRLWGLALTSAELGRVAAQVGSDVPFFLRGGTAVADGRGERVRALPPMASLPVLLLCPRATIPGKTARMYSCLTPAHYGDGAITRRMERTLDQGEFVADGMYNVFEEVAFSLFPELAHLRRTFQAAVAGNVHLAGAGPSLFCTPCSQAEYHRVTEVLQPQGSQAYLVRTVTPQPLTD